MIALSTQGEQLLLSQVFQRGNTWPASAYLALFTVVPGKDAGGVECTGSGYTRVLVNFDSVTWLGPTNSTITNAADISFGTPTAADWGTLLGFAFMFGLTAGASDLLSAGIPFAVAKTPVAGTPVIFSANTLTISSLETA